MLRGKLVFDKGEIHKISFSCPIKGTYTNFSLFLYE